MKHRICFLHYNVIFLYPDYDRIIKNIERGEARISRKDEIMKAIGKKLDRYKNPWLELKIQYGQNKGKLYNEECDRFMVSFPLNTSVECLWAVIIHHSYESYVILVHIKLHTDLHDSQAWLWELG